MLSLLLGLDDTRLASHCDVTSSDVARMRSHALVASSRVSYSIIGEALAGYPQDTIITVSRTRSSERNYEPLLLLGSGILLVIMAPERAAHP